MSWVTRWQLMLPRLASRLIGVVVATLALSGSIGAQSFDLAAHGQQIIALDQLMRFHPGDDPTLAWASPALDDSAWPLIRGNETWYAQGYPKLTGFAWYRFKITLPSPSALPSGYGIIAGSISCSAASRKPCGWAMPASSGRCRHSNGARYFGST